MIKPYPKALRRKRDFFNSIHLLYSSLGTFLLETRCRGARQCHLYDTPKPTRPRLPMRNTIWLVHLLQVSFRLELSSPSVYEICDRCWLVGTQSPAFLSRILRHSRSVRNSPSTHCLVSIFSRKKGCKSKWLFWFVENRRALEGRSAASKSVLALHVSLGLRKKGSQFYATPLYTN